NASKVLGDDQINVAGPDQFEGLEEVGSFKVFTATLAGQTYHPIREISPSIEPPTIFGFLVVQTFFVLVHSTDAAHCLGTKFKWNLGARFCVSFPAGRNTLPETTSGIELEASGV